MIIPSKELLSEVLGIGIDYNGHFELGILIYGEKGNYWRSSINIYELAHRCKEWATTKNFCITSSTFIAEEDDNDLEWIKNKNYAWAELSIVDLIFRAKTEPEAIFKACEWILQQKETK